MSVSKFIAKILCSALVIHQAKPIHNLAESVFKPSGPVPRLSFSNGALEDRILPAVLKFYEAVTPLLSIANDQITKKLPIKAVFDVAFVGGTDFAAQHALIRGEVFAFSK